PDIAGERPFQVHDALGDVDVAADDLPDRFDQFRVAHKAAHYLVIAVGVHQGSDGLFILLQDHLAPTLIAQLSDAPANHRDLFARDQLGYEDQPVRLVLGDLSVIKEMA